MKEPALLDGTVIIAKQVKNTKQECNEGLAEEKEKKVLLQRKKKKNSYYIGKEKCVSMSFLVRMVLMRKQVSDGSLELCSRNVKETGTENMWQSKRRTDGAC